MSVAEELRVRAALTGVTGRDIGKLLGLSPSRARALLGDRGAFRDLHELRQQVRDHLRGRAPNLTDVYRSLILDELRPETAGRDVRWTRQILGIGLRAWSREIGMSTWWWSVFETDPDQAVRAWQRGVLDAEQVFAVESRMLEAGVRLALVVPSCVKRWWCRAV